MQDFWLAAQKRFDNNLDHLISRLSLKWNILQQKMLVDIPHNAQQLYTIHSQLIRNRLFNTIEKMNNNLEKRWAFFKVNSTRFSDSVILFLQNRWRKLQPRLDSFVTTSFAISTATSTLHLTVQITPILLSALTILATAPMLNAILPEFLFNSTVLFFIMVAISAYAGYSKFKELETRETLDGDIKVNKEENKKLRRKVKSLKKRLHNLEEIINPTPHIPPSFVPLSDNERQSLTKSAPPILVTPIETLTTRQDSTLKR